MSGSTEDDRPASGGGNPSEGASSLAPPVAEAAPPKPTDAAPQPSTPPGEPAVPSVPLPPRPPMARIPKFQVALALLGGALVVAVNVTLVQAHVARPDAHDAAAANGSSSASSGSPSLAHSQAGISPALSVSASSDATSDPSSSPSDAPKDEPPRSDPDKPNKKEKGHTVEWAAERACSTSHVDGLSRQIIEESRCLDHNAFSRVPPRKNLANADHVFLYLDAPARDHLVRALDAHPNRVMKVHSALRTVAQQFLLSRWGAGHRCGIQLATRPGESNHETGLALDIGDHGTWRTALEAEGFKWLGSIDRVHFDFAGPGATHHDGLDVRAFQRLWNRNHPDDQLGESGRYDGATEARLKKSPANGFPTGAVCGGRDHRVAGGGSGHAHGK